MNGHLIPEIPAAVDYWRPGSVSLYFLTHCHADHLTGLSASWMRTIYCSAVSATILRHMGKVRADLLVPLEIGQSHILPVDREKTRTITVTPLEANHCPGAVMWLFQGPFGTILHTGDFRFSSEMLEHPPLVNILSGQLKLDLLYPDNTYCDRTKCFMSRQDAETKIINIIRKHSNHDVVIGLRNLGKETLLVKIALHFRTWIVVSPCRYKLLKALELPNVFTTDPNGGYIRVASAHEVTTQNVTFWSKRHPTIGILPTALHFPQRKSSSDPTKVCIVPYSDHCSFPELCQFVKALRPRCVRPVVRGPGCGVSVLSCYLDRSPPCPAVSSHACLPAPTCTMVSTGRIRRAPTKRRTEHVRKRPRTMGVVFDSDNSSVEAKEANSNAHSSTELSSSKPIELTCTTEFGDTPVIVIKPEHEYEATTKNKHDLRAVDLRVVPKCEDPLELPVSSQISIRTSLSVLHTELAATPKTAEISLVCKREISESSMCKECCTEPAVCMKSYDTKPAVCIGDCTEPTICDDTEPAVCTGDCTEPTICDDTEPAVCTGDCTEPTICDDTEPAVCTGDCTEPTICDDTEPAVCTGDCTEPTICDDTEPTVCTGDCIEPSICDGSEPTICDDTEPAVCKGVGSEPTICDGTDPKIYEGQNTEPAVCKGVGSDPKIYEGQNTEPAVCKEVGSEPTICDGTDPTICEGQNTEPAVCKGVGSDPTICEGQNTEPVVCKRDLSTNVLSDSRTSTHQPLVEKSSTKRRLPCVIIKTSREEKRKFWIANPQIPCVQILKQ